MTTTTTDTRETFCCGSTFTPEIVEWATDLWTCDACGERLHEADYLLPKGGAAKLSAMLGTLTVTGMRTTRAGAMSAVLRHNGAVAFHIEDDGNGGGSLYDRHPKAKAGAVDGVCAAINDAVRLLWGTERTIGTRTDDPKTYQIRPVNDRDRYWGDLPDVVMGRVIDRCERERFRTAAIRKTKTHLVGALDRDCSRLVCWKMPRGETAADVLAYLREHRPASIADVVWFLNESETAPEAS